MIKYFYLAIFYVLFLSACKKDAELIEPIEYKDLPNRQLSINIDGLLFEVNSSTSEKLNLPNTNQRYGYCSVVAKNGVYKMIIVEYITDYLNCKLHLFSSTDGVNWSQNNIEIENEQNIANFNEPCLFLNKHTNNYGLIFNTYTLERPYNYFSLSNDGIKWSKPIVVGNNYSDTQYSVLVEDKELIVFMRSRELVNEKLIRTISYKKLNFKGDVIKYPQAFYKSQDYEYNQSYNFTVYKFNGKQVVSLKTYYNEETDKCKVEILSVNIDDKKVTTLCNITEVLRVTNNPNFFIICSSITEAEKENEYWLYYMIKDNNHNSKGVFEHRRIKLKLR